MIGILDKSLAASINVVDDGPNRIKQQMYDEKTPVMTDRTARKTSPWIRILVGIHWAIMCRCISSGYRVCRTECDLWRKSFLYQQIFHEVCSSARTYIAPSGELTILPLSLTSIGEWGIGTRIPTHGEVTRRVRRFTSNPLFHQRMSRRSSRLQGGTRNANDWRYSGAADQVRHSG